MPRAFDGLYLLFYPGRTRHCGREDRRSTSQRPLNCSPDRPKARTAEICPRLPKPDAEPGIPVKNTRFSPLRSGIEETANVLAIQVLLPNLDKTISVPICMKDRPVRVLLADQGEFPMLPEILGESNLEQVPFSVIFRRRILRRESATNVFATEFFHRLDKSASLHECKILATPLRVVPARPGVSDLFMRVERAADSENFFSIQIFNRL